MNRRASFGWALSLAAAVATPTRALGGGLEGVQLAYYQDMSLAELLNVPITSATRHEQDVGDAPSVMTVFGEAEMRMFGFRTLADLLTYAGGLQMSRIPNGEVVPVVRGLASENGIVVLLDGAPLLDAVTGQFYHYDMSLAGLERVEILRGPGAALFGGNANAGLINLVTREPGGRGNAGLVTAGYPAAVAGNGAVVASGPAGNLRISASAEYDRGHDYHVPRDGTDGMLGSQVSLTDPASFFHVAQRGEPTTKASALLRWTGVAGLSLTSYASYRSLSPLLDPSYGGGRGPVALTIPGDFERRDVLVFGDLAWKGELWNGGTLKVALRYTLNDRLQDGYISAPVDYSSDGQRLRGVYERYNYAQHRLGPELQLDLSLPAGNLVTVGAVGSLDWVDRRSYATNFVFVTGATSVRAMPADVGERPDYFLPDNLKRWSAGAYVQDVYSPASWLDVVGGVRLDTFSDHGIVSKAQLTQDEQCRASPFGCVPKGFKSIAENGRNYNQWSPRLAIVGKLDADDLHGRLKLMAGQAFTPPPLLSLSNQSPIDHANGAFGNPFLAPTTGRTLEAAASFAVGKRTVRLSYFYLKTEDEVVFDPGKAMFANIASRTVRGFEGEASGSEAVASGFELYYRLAASRQTTSADGNRLIGIGADMYPRILGNLLLGLRWQRAASLGIGVTYVSEARREAVDVRPGVPSRYLADVTLGLDDVLVDGSRLQLTVQNIAGKSYADPLSKYLGVDGDYPRGGRQIMLSLGVSEPR